MVASRLIFLSVKSLKVRWLRCDISQRIVGFCSLLPPNDTSNRSNGIIIKQQSYNICTSYVYSSDSIKAATIHENGNGNESNVMYRNSLQFLSYLLPKSYPVSVKSGYERFVCYQMLATIFSTTSGVLAMQSLLLSMGLQHGLVTIADDQSAQANIIPLAATLNWIIKDGIGQIGGVLFASTINTSFDRNPKTWRFASVVALDVSSFLEVLIPIFPQSFLLIASVANIGKNISFLAAGASRAAIHKSFTNNENLADITAKTTSQSILSSTVGTFLGMYLSTLVYNNIPGTICVYLLCSGLNLVFTYKSLTYCTINILDQERLDFLIQQYFVFVDIVSILTDEDKINNNKQFSFNQKTILKTPIEVKANETLFFSPPMMSKDLPSIAIGSLVSDVMRNEDEAHHLTCLFRNSPYIINYHTMNNKSKKVVYLLIKLGSDTKDLVRGLIHAYFVRWYLRDCSDKSSKYHVLELTMKLFQSNTCNKSVDQSNSNSNIESCSQKDLVCQMIESFQLQLFQSEWIIDPLILEATSNRISIQ